MVLCTFSLNKLFGSLLNISSITRFYSETFHLEFSYIEVWFTDQNSYKLEIEGRINLALVFNLFSSTKKLQQIHLKLP